MDLKLPAEVEEFRGEARAFIRSELPVDIARRQSEGWHATESDLRCWFSILNARGWSVPDWPREYGGPGWSPLQSYIFEDECAAADAPHLSWRAGSSLVGPVIYTFGSPEHKSRYLPKIRSGEELWCQGFSEPNAGSDLASLRTTAVRDGNQFIVTVPVSLLPSTGATPANYGFNIWPREAAVVTGNGQITDFAPNNALLSVNGLIAVPEPASWLMMLLGFGLIGGVIRFRRRESDAVIAQVA